MSDIAWSLIGCGCVAVLAVRFVINPGIWFVVWLTSAEDESGAWQKSWSDR